MKEIILMCQHIYLYLIFCLSKLKYPNIFVLVDYRFILIFSFLLAVDLSLLMYLSISFSSTSTNLITKWSFRLHFLKFLSFLASITFNICVFITLITANRFGPIQFSNTSIILIDFFVFALKISCYFFVL